MTRWRHLTVAIGLVPALIIYVGLVMQIADMVTDIHMFFDFLFYLIAGLAWIGLSAGWRDMKVIKAAKLQQACSATNIAEAGFDPAGFTPVLVLSGSVGFDHV